MEEFADYLPRDALIMTLWLSAGRAELNSETSNSLQSEFIIIFFPEKRNKHTSRHNPRCGVCSALARRHPGTHMGLRRKESLQAQST